MQFKGSELFAILQNSLFRVSYLPLSDDVEYEYDDILKELDSFIDAQKREVKKDTKIAEIISDVINAGIDNT